MLGELNADHGKVCAYETKMDEVVRDQRDVVTQRDNYRRRIERAPTKTTGMCRLLPKISTAQPQFKTPATGPFSKFKSCDTPTTSFADVTGISAEYFYWPPTPTLFSTGSSYKYLSSPLMSPSSFLHIISAYSTIRS
jgi:hypothetical protein